MSCLHFLLFSFFDHIGYTVNFMVVLGNNNNNNNNKVININFSRTVRHVLCYYNGLWNVFIDLR